ncbi:hypothetical protein AB1287_06685 [Enterobacter asburiae]|uniref:hypothetical protein n=1 Tax=Scandinavium sp. UTDF21-P1B TaxID=3446379 RepID=UPI003496F815
MTPLASFLLSIFVKGSKRGSVNELPLSGLAIVEKKTRKASYNKVQSTGKNSVCFGLILVIALVVGRHNDKICEETVDYQQGLSELETFGYTINALRQHKSDRVS